jgi:type 1 glutamine amidotransferase
MHAGFTFKSSNPDSPVNTPPSVNTYKQNNHYSLNPNLEVLALLGINYTKTSPGVRMNR